MKVIALLFVSVLVRAQQPSGPAATQRACSPANTGNNNIFNITCQGISNKLGAQLVDLLNRVAKNQIDAEAIMTKLDGCLEAVKDRIFTPDQRSRFIAALSGKTKFPIMFRSPDGEPVRYANQITEALAGWPIDIRGLGISALKIGDQPSPPGLIIIGFGSIANAMVLRNAFKAAGIETAGIPIELLRNDELSVFVPLKQ